MISSLFMYEGKSIVVAVNPGSTSTKVKVYNRVDGKKLYGGDFNEKDFQSLLVSLREGEDVSFAIRIVHAGSLSETTLLTDEIEKKIKEFIHFAPIHNTLALERIRLIKSLFPESKIYVVFDFGFHSTIPEEHYTYLIHKEIIERFGLRKYGFHGIALRSLIKKIKKRCEEKEMTFPSHLVAAHLGGGCSITAIKDGKSFATTMELTPLSGLPMITRSGSVDPSIYPILVRKGLSVDEIDDLLEKKSGFYGFLGTKDTKEIFQRASDGEQQSSLAFRIFVSEVVRHIIGYGGLMGSLDAVAFSGGIGFGNEYFRSVVVERLSVFLNREFEVFVIDVDEERVMFEDVVFLEEGK